MQKNLLIAALVVAVLFAFYWWYTHSYKNGGSSLWLATTDTSQTCPSGTTTAATGVTNCVYASLSDASAACSSSDSCLGYLAVGPTTATAKSLALASGVSAPTATSPLGVLIGVAPTACTACTDATYYAKRRQPSATA